MSETIHNYYTVKEAAEILGRDVSAISRYIRQGRFKPHQVKRLPQILILRSAVDSFRPPRVGNPNLFKQADRLAKMQRKRAES